MRRLAACLVTLWLAAVCLGCADTTPAKIKYDAPPAMVLNGSLFSLNGAVVNAKGEVLSGQAVSCSAAPADVIEVSSRGTVRCLKTGDATVTLAGGGLGASVPLKCRLPTEIAMPGDMQLVLGAAPVAVHAQALGEGRRALSDVPVRITSSNPSVVTVDGDVAKPVSVGRARLQGSVEAITAVTPVEVVEKVVTESLVLKDGAARSWTLKQGDYLVTVEVKPDVKVNQGVTVSWSGSACENRPEGPSHRVRCRVVDSATVTVANPKQLGLGARMIGTVSIFRVPGD